jgi:hypothetical protein
MTVKPQEEESEKVVPTGNLVTVGADACAEVAVESPDATSVAATSRSPRLVER